jgi:S1-C subfamily serine protease
LWGAVLGPSVLLSEAPPPTDSSRRVPRPATPPEIREPESIVPPRNADESRAPVAARSEPRARRPQPERVASADAQMRRQREAERRLAQRVPEVPVAPTMREPEAPPRATTPPTASSASAPAESPVAPSAPSRTPTPSEESARPPARPPDDAPAPNESRPPATARIEPAVPGALGPLTGGAALETLSQSPSPVATRQSREAAALVEPRTSREIPAWSAESPRWDRASVAETMRAVVDIRPARRLTMAADRAAPGPTSADGRPRAHRGFIFDRQGYIITSDQSLGGAGTFEVTLHDGRVLGANVVARDRLNDIAVLKVDRSGLPAMRFGDSGALAVGQRVLGVGHGSGAERSPVVGTVLATGAGTGGHMAIDLPPGPEGVGGPLLNQQGHAVGIVTESTPATGGRRALTFAVPVDRVKANLGTLTSRPIAGAEPAEGR